MLSKYKWLLFYICTCLFTTGLLPIAIRGFTLLIYGYKSESSHIIVEYYDNSNSVPLQSRLLTPLKTSRALSDDNLIAHQSQDQCARSL